MLEQTGTHTYRQKELIRKYSPQVAKPKPVTIMLSGGGVVIRPKAGQDPLKLLELAVAELRKASRAAA